MVGAASYRPCPKCGRKVSIDLLSDGSCVVGTHSPSPPVRSVCPGSGLDGRPFLKKETKSAVYRRNLKAQRRLDAAIKRHDKSGVDAGESGVLPFQQ